MTSVMENVHGKLIDAQKIREEREKELMIQREKMENVRKLVRERTDLMNINHNSYKNDLKNLNSISMNEISRSNINSLHNHNYMHDSIDNLLNNYSSSSIYNPAINIANIKKDSNTTLNGLNYYKNINHDNKKFMLNANEKKESKYGNILNLWNFPKKKSLAGSKDSSATDLLNEINNSEHNLNRSSSTTFKIQKKKNEIYHLNNKNIRLKSLNTTSIKTDESSKIDLNNSENDNGKETELSSYPYNNERLYIKPYICEKQYRKGLDRHNSNLSNFGKPKNRSRGKNNEIDASLFNGNPCIPESLKLRLESEKSNSGIDKIYFNNPNNIFKKNSALIDAMEAEKQLNENMEKDLNKLNGPLESETDDLLVENDISATLSNQNEKYRKTFDREKFKKANNRYF